LSLAYQHLRKAKAKRCTLKRISLFKLGLVLAIIGIIWVGFVFLQSEKTYQKIGLEAGQTGTIIGNFEDSGIGFYQLTMPEFSRDSLFIQILDSHENVIADKKIETKKAVNYFDFSSSGQYVLKITNLSERLVEVEVEFGDTNVSVIRIPAIVVLSGIVLMIISSARKLWSYKMAQPSEKIS
jgi:hypothetical protein